MLADISHGRAQALLKQRNMLAVLVLTLIGLMMVIIMMFVSRDREVILQPVLSRPLTIKSTTPTEPSSATKHASSPRATPSKRA